jgi:phosphoribosylformylglycinamidine synthase
VSGLTEACETLGVPVVGGNVSLYNEGPDGPIYPTPVIGMVGELPDPSAAAGSAFAAEGEAIALIGPLAPSLQGSELAKLRGELDMGLPEPDIEAVAAASALVREAVRAERVSSAHDVSDGGLACAIAECAIGNGIGCRIDLSALIERGASAEEALFGEGRGGFIVAGDRAELESLAGDSVPLIVIGETGGDRISIAAAGAELTVSIENAAQAWSSLSERLG